MKFNICVAIQVKSGNTNDNETVIKKALDAKADLIELRFDYIDDSQKLNQEFLKSLLNLIQPQVSSIFTFRAYSEGGQMEIGENSRYEIIKTLIRAKPEYLDIEMNTEIQILEQIIDLSLDNNVKLIFSYHDYNKTPEFNESLKLLEDFTTKIKLEKNHILKAIFTAQKFEDNFIPLKLCREIKKKNQEIISFCMGEEGIFSRISCMKFGSSFTYASIADSTAPGQININKIREVSKLLFSGD
jgi:3-dehydroquinate dehydratase-1